MTGDGRRGPNRHGMRRSFLLFLFEDGPGDVADAMDLRPVDPGPGLGFVTPRAGRAAAAFQDMRAYTFGFVRLDGTGVRLLLGHANGGQSFQDFPALDLQLAR
jgi:hypothetical protein